MSGCWKYSINFMKKKLNKVIIEEYIYNTFHNTQYFLSQAASRMQIKLRTGSNQALGYRKWLHLIKWAISFKMSIFLLISKSVTFVNLQSLTLCSRKQNASSVVDLKPNQFPALYWPKFSAEFSLNNRCRDYFSCKVLEQLRICYQQLQRILKTYWGGL